MFVPQRLGARVQSLEVALRASDADAAAAARILADDVDKRVDTATRKHQMRLGMFHIFAC